MPVCPLCQRDLGSARFCPYDGTPLAHLGHEAPSFEELGPGAVVDGRYVVERELGRGAVGVVYEARSTALDERVAVKVLQPAVARSDRTLSRFAREARASSRIDHPNVVRVFDFGFAEEGYYFLVMELLDGRSLAEHLEQQPKLSPARALPILSQVAEGVARAHELGVIHRDLKPENVVLTRGDGERVTVVDFGLSKSVDPTSEGNQLTREGTLVGTPEYMPPEQWMGKAVDTRTDVYAFGAMAYEVLTGELPFTGATVVIKMQRHLRWTPPELDTILPSLPRGLSALIGRCLQKRPDDRPRDMGAVANELARIRHASDPMSHPDSDAPEAQMTELVIADLSVLSTESLREEIERLRTVRRRRLTEVVSARLAADPSTRSMVERVERAEAVVEREERERAICLADLEERRAARRLREAELRQAMVQASLHLAIRREGLPIEATVWEPDTVPELDVARERLTEAEAALGQLLRTPDPSLAAAWDAEKLARARVEDADAALQSLYDALERDLREMPEGRAVASQLTRVDGAIAAYRAQLARAQRASRAEPD